MVAEGENQDTFDYERDFFPVVQDDESDRELNAGRALTSMNGSCSSGAAAALPGDVAGETPPGDGTSPPGDGTSPPGDGAGEENPATSFPGGGADSNGNAAETHTPKKRKSADNSSPSRAGGSPYETRHSKRSAITAPAITAV